MLQSWWISWRTWYHGSSTRRRTWIGWDWCAPTWMHWIYQIVGRNHWRRWPPKVNNRIITMVTMVFTRICAKCRRLSLHNRLRITRWGREQQQKKCSNCAAQHVKPKEEDDRNCRWVCQPSVSSNFAKCCKIIGAFCAQKHRMMSDFFPSAECC